ncbi:hypothetical protein ACI65C_013657 [Semiaphis heraclei]
MENETFCIGNKDNANISLNVIESTDHQKSVNNKVITRGLSVAGKGALSSISTSVRRVRHQNGPQIPVAPLTLFDLEIPESFKEYEVEPGVFENFLLCDTGPGNNRIILFCRQRGCRNGGVHPCIYAILPNKSQATYNNMLVQIKNLSPGINVESVSVDFEQAIHNAFRNEFPEVEIHGCFFHLLQNLKKQIGTAGLMGFYRNNADFNLYARMITALAVVPPEYVVESFEMLSEELEQVEPTLQPILDWLEMYYIGILRREGVRRVPTFPIETWNLYNRKTNNVAEASHRRLQAQLSMNHPTIWQFIIELKKVQAERDLYYEFLVGGHEPPPSKKKIRQSIKPHITFSSTFQGP